MFCDIHDINHVQLCILNLKWQAVNGFWKDFKFNRSRQFSRLHFLFKKFLKFYRNSLFEWSTKTKVNPKGAMKNVSTGAACWLFQPFPNADGDKRGWNFN